MGSRRQCESIVAAGRIAVNGKVVTELGSKADPETDEITLDGRPVGAAAEKVYILLNKPPGYTSTRSDPHAKHTVLELLADSDALGQEASRSITDVFLYPIGRLDVDTAGLLILTNDGELTKLLSHPSHEVDKVYVAVVRGRIRASELEWLQRGVELEDGVTSPARARLISTASDSSTSTVEITIHEGRKRQIRRMFAVVGHRVERLTRVRIGNLDLKGLREGQYRRLTKKEVAELRKLAFGSASRKHEKTKARKPEGKNAKTRKAER